MFDAPFSKFSFFLSLAFSFFILFLILYNSLNNSKTTVVFCDVGQGDGTYIRLKNQTDILIDAGPNRKILECLGKYMPFYDRSIELGIISHAQKDHFGGFLYLLDRYDIKKIWLSEVHDNNKQFKEFIDKTVTKGIRLEFPKAGESSDFSGGKIDFFWPSDDYITQNSDSENKGIVNFSQAFKDLNYYSLIFQFELEGTNILFTGDAPALILSRLLRQSKIKSDIVKIPHHGSKNGLTLEFLKLADPIYGVISSGKNNSYGHPHPQILDMLTNQNVVIKRTDEEGDIVFKF